MAPKAKSEVAHVDGVHCILNISSRVVVVGTGLVANAERDTFKLKASGGSLADQTNFFSACWSRPCADDSQMMRSKMGHMDCLCMEWCDAGGDWVV